jgi:hypothetical protein
MPKLPQICWRIAQCCPTGLLQSLPKIRPVPSEHGLKDLKVLQTIILAR